MYVCVSVCSCAHSLISVEHKQWKRKRKRNGISSDDIREISVRIIKFSLFKQQSMNWYLYTYVMCKIIGDATGLQQRIAYQSNWRRSRRKIIPRDINDDDDEREIYAFFVVFLTLLSWRFYIVCIVINARSCAHRTIFSLCDWCVRTIRNLECTGKWQAYSMRYYVML